ncbi:MAG: methyltransferase domain-containing protein [Candidatus Eisenbacteria bacterium]|nr:methyltransferase domain-containing protein [Candidatus Eisenbacteria bacterium]
MDIATGLGNVLHWVLGACPSCGHLIGIDVALAALRSARTALTDRRVRLLAMDGAHLAMRDASVDMVTLAYSLHHLPDVAGTLREAGRVLMPGGRLLIVEMHRDEALPSQALHNDMHGWWAAVDTAVGVSHRRIYTRGQILQFIAPLAMEEITVIEDPGDESQARDEEVLQVYRKRFDTYADKARGQVQYESLVARGQELKARMLQTGCSLPRAVIVTARKPREG